MSAPKSLFIGSNEPSRYVEFKEFNGHKFRYRIEFTNGDPCGFNTKQSVAVMTSDGDWSNIADSCMLGCKEPNIYVSQNIFKISARKRLINAFDNFISKVY